MANISKIKIGDNSYTLKDPNGITSIPIATANSYGLIKPDNETVTIDSTGKLSVTPYDLPNATKDEKGGIKIYYDESTHYLYISNNGESPI